MPVRPIPEGYPTATPYLAVRGAADAIDFYKRAFGATEVMRMPGPGGAVMHAEVRIGNSPVMLADEMPGMRCTGPQTVGGTTVTLHLYVEDVDAVVAKAVEAGAKVIRPVQNMFYGDRTGAVEDPFGHVWHIATHVEDVTPDEMTRRHAALMKNPAA
jgi:PhnB protein